MIDLGTGNNNKMLVRFGDRGWLESGSRSWGCRSWPMSDKQEVNLEVSASMVKQSVEIDISIR